MSELTIDFSEPISKRTASRLAIEYLKYVLYNRGQFPRPLDQLKQKNVKPAPQQESLKNNYTIFSDNPNLQFNSSGLVPKPNFTLDRKKQLFEDTIKKFDEFFDELLDILENKAVLELVMNLGPNMMSPKELHHITLPSSHCDHAQCSERFLPYHKSRSRLYKCIYHGNILEGMKSENLTQITVLLLLRTDDPLTEHMEQKNFYKIPNKCRQFSLNFDNSCQMSAADFTDLPSDSVTNSQNSGLWVKLKRDLKGFKDLVDSKQG